MNAETSRDDSRLAETQEGTDWCPALFLWVLFSIIQII
ncbi:hypothetical protein FH063_001239 [Azospirillum argentinense]|uniref:Uncharacterized protein n=1 Tax=Azospirillum argentinense TaxID=2970906 RepID=A0A5B0L3X4_9PROT|nr:hypothetical protein FH063_001239 [Azospirillum argentinense]